MTDPGGGTSRRFNEKEVALIIKRASELQQMESTAESSTGMSLAELEQVAREAGLDPELVRRAAVDLDTRVTDQKPNRCPRRADRVCASSARSTARCPPTSTSRWCSRCSACWAGWASASTLGRTLQFSMTGVRRRHASERAVQVTVTPRNGRTTIRIEEPLGPLAGGLFGGVMGGMGGGLTGHRDRHRGRRVSFRDHSPPAWPAWRSADRISSRAPSTGGSCEDAASGCRS